MPLTDCPFIQWPDGIYRPTLPIRIINPHTLKSLKTYGLIDTGSDDCAVPAYYADPLGHNLVEGKKRQSDTGNGLTDVYEHITKLEIFNPLTGQIIYAVEDISVDFLPNLKVCLLGVKSFLGKFILYINYECKFFSIKYPEKKENKNSKP